MDRRSILIGLGAAGMASLAPNRAMAAPPQLVDPLDHGAKADGRTDDRAAIQRAIDACAAAGGGVVVLSPGRTFLSGGVELRNDVCLYLGAGAALKAAADRASYGDRGALVFARGASGCGVAGPGTIEGNWSAFLSSRAGGGFESAYTFLGRWDPERPGGIGATAATGRPRMLLFVGCRRVALADFQIVGAPSWTVHLLGCEDVSVTRISIRNEITVPNCDGIDIDRCRRVRVSGCDIRAGDDGICLKASSAFGDMGPCEDITVTGCTITSGSSAIKLGSAATSPIRRVVVSSCVISDSNRGVALQNRDGSTYENIVFSDLVISTRYYPSEWWGAAEPIHISNVPRLADQASSGTIRGISFADIRCVGESGVFIHGAPASPVEDITLRGVSVELTKQSNELGGFYDLRPSARNKDVHRSAIAGVHAEGVDRLALRDVDVLFRPPVAEIYGPALWTRRVRNLDATGFRGSRVHAATRRRGSL